MTTWEIDDDIIVVTFPRDEKCASTFDFMNFGTYLQKFHEQNS